MTVNMKRCLFICFYLFYCTPDLPYFNHTSLFHIAICKCYLYKINAYLFNPCLTLLFLLVVLLNMGYILLQKLTLQNL